MNKKPVAIVTGQTAAGKSTLADYLRKAGFSTAEFSEFFANRLRLGDMGRSRSKTAITKYIASTGRDAYIRAFLHWVRRRHRESNGLPVLLVGARHPDDIALIKKYCRVLGVVGIIASARVRARRMKARAKLIDSSSALEPLTDGLVTACIRQHATIMIDNNASPDRFQIAVASVGRTLKLAAKSKGV